MSTRNDKIIAVIKASEIQGVRVEYKGQKGWVATEDPGWNFAHLRYRVLAPKAVAKRRITAKDWEVIATTEDSQK